jgi:hypothetical protein
MMGNCVDPATDCPAPSGACVDAICDANKMCAEQPKPADTPTPNEVAGDCKKHACDGAGAESVTNDDADLPADDGNDCTAEACSAGAPQHNPKMAGAACGDATQACTNGMENKPDTCNAAGQCQPNDNVSCGLYTCGANACKATCASDTDCVAGNYCGGGVCTPKKAVAATCGASNECSSGFCADGVCCMSACSGLCEACNLAGSEGACSPVDPLVDDVMCPMGQTCDGGGMCKLDVGEPCSMPAECATGVCSVGQCAP